MCMSGQLAVVGLEVVEANKMNKTFSRSAEEGKSTAMRSVYMQSLCRVHMYVLCCRSDHMYPTAVVQVDTA